MCNARAEVFQSIGGGSERRRQFAFHKALVFLIVKFCGRNARLAMLDIYLTEATHHHVNAILMLTIVTCVVLLAFMPRMLGVDL